MRATTKLAALAAILVVTGCGQTVAGTAAPNPEAARLATGTAYEASLRALQKYISESTDFRGTVYRYAAINEKKSGSEVSVSKEGDPAAVITKIKSTSNPGYDYDWYVPAAPATQNTVTEYVRLGQGYAKLAPTQWVSMPGRPASNFACAVSGLQTLCKLNDAIVSTERAAPPGLTKSATRLDAGATEMRTEITLQAFLDKAVIPIPADVTALIEPDMMGKLIPTKIVVNRDNTLRRIEVRGEIPGRQGRVQLEVGYEARGPAAASDFPPIPPPAEVTALPDKAAADDFWARLGSIRG